MREVVGGSGLSIRERKVDSQKVNALLTKSTTKPFSLCMRKRGKEDHLGLGLVD